MPNNRAPHCRTDVDSVPLLFATKLVSAFIDAILAVQIGETVPVVTPPTLHPALLANGRGA